MLKILNKAFYFTNIKNSIFVTTQLSLQSFLAINKENIMVSYRHAQTQHGSNQLNDEENITVLRKSHSPIPHSDVIVSETIQSLSNKTNNLSESSFEKETSNNIDLQSSDVIKNSLENENDCVWFYKCESSPEKDNILISADPSNTICSAEKRKSNTQSITKLTKRPKLDSSALKEKRPGFSEDRYNETSYYFENNLRKVYPYFFTFTTFTKGRWVGEKIIDVFSREFRAHPTEEYERSINAGSLIVNYEKVPTDYILKHNDLLANIVHRHEVPVTSQPIKIVEMNEDMVVVNKPASIPVHPCGRYRHNTVVFILAKEFNLKNLKTIHRLDRLTSGLLLFGRNLKKAREMELQIRNREVKKQYVCRVEGEFPDDVIECNEPIEVVSYKIGVCKVSIKGKDCKTTFKKLNFDGKSSIVLCKPLTGRMHQIRVHLQYLGFPIINDPLYNHDVFGPQKGKFGDFGGKTDEQLVQDLILIHNAENWLSVDNDSDLFKPSANKISNVIIPKDKPDNKIELENFSQKDQNELKENKNECDKESYTSAIIENKFDVATQTDHDAPDMKFDLTKMTQDEHCYECKINFSDPKPKDLIMYLHAWKYEGPGWKYETDLPNWAKF